MKKNYIKLSNEILEVLARTKLSNYEFRYLWVVIRKTLGWNKVSDYISNSQFVKETDIKKYHIWRTEKRLIWRNIVTKRGNKLSFNTNYGEWRKLPIGATVTNSGIKVTNLGKKVTNRGGHKEHSTKNIIQIKEDDKTPSLDINSLISCLRETNKLANLDGSVKQNRQYAHLCLKKFGLEETQKVISIGSGDKFHSQNLTNFRYLFNNFEKIKRSTTEKKPFYRGDPMVWSETKRKRYVISPEGEWLEFAGKDSEIEWRSPD